jgi:hypothetical protein
VMYSAASRKVTSFLPLGNAIGSSNLSDQLNAASRLRRRQS